MKFWIGDQLVLDVPAVLLIVVMAIACIAATVWYIRGNA